MTNSKTSIALITGASSGIGKAIYEGLHDFFDGQIIGLSRRGPDICMDVRKIISDGVPILHADAQISLLVNNAGIMPMESFDNLFDTKLNRKIFDVNFWGAYNLIGNLQPLFAEECCIINIASISGIIHDADIPIYSASKAAMISMTKSLAKRFAPSVRVNCISPGFYHSNLAPGDTPQELIDAVPLKYEEKPENLVSIVKMIYQTKYMTGANIVIDGGASC